jgi:cell division septal protein FtsQ
MKIDLTSLQNSLGKLPQVQSVLVERFFPNRIDINVTERQPVAWLACAPKGVLPRDTLHGRLLDENGTVFECRSLMNPYNHLPVINIPQLAWMEIGQPLTDRRATQALRLIEAFNQQTWCQPLRIQEVLLANDYAQTVTMKDGATITFSAENFPQQMKRLAKIYQWSKEQDRSLATVQLLAETNIPVTFAAKAKGASASTDTKPATPSPTKANRTVARPPIPRDAADIRAIVRGN